MGSLPPSSHNDCSRPDSPDEVNRLWQHGLHEERLFHDRLNYFSILEMGLLTIYSVMYNKEPALAFFLPLTAVALLFTLLWLVIQARHWAYCEHVTARVQRLVPEFRATVAEFSAGRWSRSFSVSKVLALSVPGLFALTWIAFFVWLLVRPTGAPQSGGVVSLELVLLVVLASALVWVAIRLRRVERRLGEMKEASSVPSRIPAIPDTQDNTKAPAT